jgi:hypothetical protein
MIKLNSVEFGSLAGAVTSIGASLTLERAGVIVGIVTALLTCVGNVAYMVQKNRREQRESDANLARLGVKQ